MKNLSLTLLTFLISLSAICSANIDRQNGDIIYFTQFPDAHLKESESSELFQEKYRPAFFDSPKKTDDQVILEKALGLESSLQKKIFGQDDAVKTTADAIIRYASGVNDPNAPIASLLYCGPSGVGKTELAKQLCIELYGSLTRLIRFDMAEYSEAFTIARFVGSPPGYAGYGEGGQLTNALINSPYSVVLFDEVEKAHPKVLKLLLRALDEGFVNSAMGQKVDCRKAIFILTSNLAAPEIADLYSQGWSIEQITEILKSFYMHELSPELFNRLDLVIFAPLGNQYIESLVYKMLNSLAERVYASKKIRLQFDRSLVEYFMRFAIDPKLGARPLKRLIDKQLATVLARVIIGQNLKKDDQLLCSYAEGTIYVQKLK